ncbi:MAG TPA: SMI1/KNR4 family protein [Pyrinomonadaceae bacterium]|nr:SMI1/KNR4 family protein [Pyrinomonadaceae bacterium]
MHLEQVSLRLQKLELDYQLAGPASEREILGAERRLNVTLPKQVKQFYESYDGLRVHDPHLEILSVAKLNLTSSDHLHFATVDFDHRLVFDVSHLNPAGQWDIKADDGFLITRTMASLWSVKIWAWLENRKRIWCEL